MKKENQEIEREELKFWHKFATEVLTQESEDCYSVEWIYINGLRAYTDAKIHFTGIETIWNLRSNDFEVAFVVKNNNAICDWDCEDLKKWANNGFKGVKALIVKGEGSKFWHYITPKAEDYEISRAYANCEDCLRDIILQ